MVETVAPHMLDLVCLLVSIALFTGFNVLIWCRLRRNPLYTLQGATNLARKAWVVSVMEEKKDILAVQTLRNSTMAATFMASTAILLTVGVLTLTGQSENLKHTWHAFNLFGSTAQSTLTLKLLVLLANLFIAFFSFSASIRLYNHVGFLLNVPPTDGDYSTSFTFVAIQLNRAASQYHLGMRAFYFMVPLVFWLFDPLFMVGSTMLMIGVVFWMDKTPKMECDYLSSQHDQRICKL